MGRIDLLDIDAYFVESVRLGRFPVAGGSEEGIAEPLFLVLFQNQMLARHIDLQARLLKTRNLSFYTIGSAGHEGNAGVAAVFRNTDMAFLHYRSGAFMLQRAMGVPGENQVRDQLRSLMASKRDPISQGRHKVFGSVYLNVPPQTSTIASHLPKAVGAALAITQAKALHYSNAVLPEDAVILCSFGDASCHHSTAQGAFNLACYLAYQHIPLPLVLICEDNGLGISVPTPKGWIADRMRQHTELIYLSADGLNVAQVVLRAQEAEHYARVLKKPVFLHLNMVRLMGHAGSDIETQYRTMADILTTQGQDPLLHSARMAVTRGYLQASEVIARYESCRQIVRETAESLIDEPKLSTRAEVMASIIPPMATDPPPPLAPLALKCQYDAQEPHREHSDQPVFKNLAQLMNFALAETLELYSNSCIFGEDVGRKGGVYRVTAGLQAQFGIKRVFDTLLDEQSILGTAIGFAMNGLLPIPEIQFLAYVHNAIDQIRGEAATLSFFSAGQYTNPMIIRIAGLGYQKGFGGHFHNENTVAALREIPGIVIACPSTGHEAVLLWRACVRLAVQYRRVCIFIEPIALYFTRDLHRPQDDLWACVDPRSGAEAALGSVRLLGEPSAQLVITYGNGVYWSAQAAEILKQEYGVVLAILDLRWIAPLPLEALWAYWGRSAVPQVRAVVIVDECRATGSVGEGLMSYFLEQQQLGKLCPDLKVACVTAADSFIPLGPAAHTVLPSVSEIVQAVLQLLN
jgi:2-oxoisovalerate dehydrogenase E1 component